MTTTTLEEQIAEAEAEPEEEEAEEETPTDDEEEAEEEAEEEQVEQLAQIGPDELRKAERATEAQRRKLAGILGDAFVAHECIFCAALGFTPELPPVGATFVIHGEGDERGFEVRAPISQRPLKQAPDKAMCDECDGEGFTLTGARDPQKAQAPCGKCNGNAWVTVPRPEPVYTPPPPLSAATYVPPPARDVTGPPDAWGRPYGHQHWGVNPASIPG